jgi:SAM-dependent methyltransferase
LVTFDPSTLAGRDLQYLRAGLLAAGYRSETLADSLRVKGAAALMSDIARISLICCDSLGTSPSAVLGKLFLLCAPVPMRVFGKLPRPLTQSLHEHGLVHIDSGGQHVIGRVSITEVDEFYFLADRLFENRFGTITVTTPDDVCMTPHASSFELMKAIARGRAGSAVLDVGCGSGCLSLPLARPAGHVTGIDTSGRAVAFARANASLNGVRAQFEQAAWQNYDSQQRYDHILFNTPGPSTAFDFVTAGIPRFLAPGGRAEVWLTCEVLAEDGDIRGTVDRMSTIEPPFDLRIMVNDRSPCSLSREAVASRRRPGHTLVVKHPAEWRAYVDSLHSRGVVEVASIVLEITHRGTPPAREMPGQSSPDARKRLTLPSTSSL